MASALPALAHVGEVVRENQGHKDDRKVCLPTVRETQRERLLGKGGATENKMLLGHATESRNWVSGWPKLVLMLDSAIAVKARSGLGSMHISIRRQQSPQMVVMATEITVRRLSAPLY